MILRPLVLCSALCLLVAALWFSARDRGDGVSAPSAGPRALVVPPAEPAGAIENEPIAGARPPVTITGGSASAAASTALVPEPGPPEEPVAALAVPTEPAAAPVVDFSLDQRELPGAGDATGGDASPGAPVVVPSSYPISDAAKYFVPREERRPGNLGGPPPLDFPGGPNDPAGGGFAPPTAPGD